ncbi:MAG: hypothetical protein JO314_06535, partial [Acidobacteria bacterium]|nr:hypothetical protein [Acidobacteriota bacterium]
MRKLLYAIAAVFCIQICFQVLMSLDLTNIEFAALRTPLENPLPYQKADDAAIDNADLVIARAVEYKRPQASSPVPARIAPQFTVVRAVPTRQPQTNA